MWIILGVFVMAVTDCPQGRWEGSPEVLHWSLLLLWPVEGADAAGHQGYHEGETQAPSETTNMLIGWKYESQS